jgi:hypothetical protein
VTPLRKYQILLLGTVVLFLYICSTEVFARYGKLWQSYTLLQQKRESTRDPQALAAERARLLLRLKALKISLRAQSGDFEQSQTGALEFINFAATKATVRLESLIPTKHDGAVETKELSFKLSCTGPFHRVGSFLNALERGPFAFRLNKLEVTKEGAPASSVKAVMEGAIHLAQ